jgi:hypothetical protein
MLELSRILKNFRKELNEIKNNLKDYNRMPDTRFKELYTATMALFRVYDTRIEEKVLEDIDYVDNFETDTGNQITIKVFESINDSIALLTSKLLEYGRFYEQNLDRAHNHPSGVPQPPIEIGSATLPRSSLLTMLEETILLCNLSIANIDYLIKHIDPHNPQVANQPSSQLAAAASAADAALVRWQESRYADTMAPAKGGNRGKKKSLHRRKTLKKKSPRKSSRKSSRKSPRKTPRKTPRKKPKTKHRKKRVLPKKTRR